MIDASDFGYIPGCADSSGLQAAIDAAAANNGGIVNVMPSATPYPLENVLVRAGVRVECESQGTRRQRGGGNYEYEGCTRFEVTGSGYGIIFAEPLALPWNTGLQRHPNGASWNGGAIVCVSQAALGGVRIGPVDHRMCGVNQCLLNVGIYDFNIANAVHPVYDGGTEPTTTSDLATPVTGAAGLIICGGISDSFRNVHIGNCHYGIVESSGKQATTSKFSNCRFHLNQIGVELRGCRSYLFSGCIFEGSQLEGLKLWSCSAAESTSGVTLISPHFENNAKAGGYSVATSHITGLQHRDLFIFGGKLNSGTKNCVSLHNIRNVQIDSRLQSTTSAVGLYVGKKQTTESIWVRGEIDGLVNLDAPSGSVIVDKGTQAAWVRTGAI